MLCDYVSYDAKCFNRVCRSSKHDENVNISIFVLGTSFLHKRDFPSGMDEHDQKYHDFIASATSNLVKVAEDNLKFDKYYNQLHAVVPKYGLSLEEFTLLLDIVIDPHSEFKSVQKNKLLTLLYCRDLLDFDCVLKIVSVFKVPSYYNKKSATVILSKAIQTKLSSFLLRNFVNIRWEKKFLRLLNWLYDLLSIGYLRLNIGLFLIYFLSLSPEIDPLYDKRYFYTAKKLNSVLEFYELDKSNSLPLLLSFAAYLSSTNRGYSFDLIFSKYLLVLSDAKIPKDVFGKKELSQIVQLIEMKRLANKDWDEIEIFQSNVKFYIQLLSNLNQSFGSNLASNVLKKRKYLEDESMASVLKNASLYHLYSPRLLAEELSIDVKPYDLTAIAVLKFLSALELKTLEAPNFAPDLPTEYSDPLFIFYAPILTVLVNSNFEALNRAITEIMKTDEGVVSLTSGLHWIFKGLANFCALHPKHILLSCVKDVLLGRIEVDFTGSQDEMMQILCVSDFIQFLEPDFARYEDVLDRLLGMTLKLNNVRMMRGLVLLASNWMDSPDEFNKLFTLILRNLDYNNSPLHNEVLLLLPLVQSMPYSSIDITQLVLHSDFTAMIFFSNDLFNINLLLQHVLFCKQYFAEFGLRQIENSVSQNNYALLKAVKELHNSYVMDICNFLWRNRAYHAKDISSGRFFGFPSAFVDKLEPKPMDLAHLPATRGISVRSAKSSEGPQGAISEDMRMLVLKELVQQSYSGVVRLLQSSIRGLNN